MERTTKFSRESKVSSRSHSPRSTDTLATAPQQTWRTLQLFIPVSHDDAHVKLRPFLPLSVATVAGDDSLSPSLSFFDFRFFLETGSLIGSFFLFRLPSRIKPVLPLSSIAAAELVLLVSENRFCGRGRVARVESISVVTVGGVGVIWEVMSEENGRN